MALYAYYKVLYSILLHTDTMHSDVTFSNLYSFSLGTLRTADRQKSKLIEVGLQKHNMRVL